MISSLSCRTAEEAIRSRRCRATYPYRALAEGRYVAAPAPRVVGHALADVQHALDVQRKGVSAQKIVIALDPRDDGPDTDT